MKYYWVKTNRVVKWLLPKFLWEIKTDRKAVYLTFDDGPTPEITEWVLLQLQMYNAKATFFCIGNNVKNNSEIYKQIIASGHAIGNHTSDHRNGWKSECISYIKSVKECEDELRKHGALNTKLFRPPYGKLKHKQFRELQKMDYTVVMWDVLSADFDNTITPEKCLDNVLKNIVAGSIIIFHDSLKAYTNLNYVLPKTLAFLNREGYRCESIV